MGRSTSRSGSRQDHPSGPSPPRGRAATIASNLSRGSSKENHAPPDAEEYETQRRRIEELKAEVGTLKYQINSYEQEKELSRLQTENELREAKRHAEEDFKARHAAERETSKALRQLDALQNELEALRAERDSQRRGQEGRAREAEEEARLLQEQLEDLNAAKDEAARLAEREINDLKSRLAVSQRANQELEEEARARDEILEKTQSLLVERDETIGNLEADVLRLKAHTGDAETIAVIRRELTEQVTHIRALEAKNREQLTELRHLRQVHKAVEIVEEEKRSLIRKLEAAESLETELNEARTQRQRLEDEKRAWSAYLQGQSLEFETPADLARALIEERLNSARLLEQLGSLEPEIADRENIIKSLEQEKIGLKNQIEKLKAAAPTGEVDKARARVEGFRLLAVKEADFLRAQVKTLEMAMETMLPETVEEAKSTRIQELESLVEKYKEEVNTLHASLTSLESGIPAGLPATGSKRPREADDEADSERLGELSRKNRKLQSELSTAQAALKAAEIARDVANEQLSATQEQLKTRVLSLRSNPTSDYEAVKVATLRALKLENAELLAHIQQQPTFFATVPASQLAAAQREIAEANAKTASAEKSSRRLKEVWAAKSAEFKEAVFSTLGWTVTFIPGGKMRVESVYYPSKTDEHENSIVFDGDKGTMKVGGGPRSAFAEKIGDNIKFWLRERGCVPCFLAALTLEFYEEHSRQASS